MLHQGCIQKYKVIVNVPNDQRQQEQGSRAIRLLVTCTSARSPGYIRKKWNEQVHSLVHYKSLKTGSQTQLLH